MDFLKWLSSLAVLGEPPPTRCSAACGWSFVDSVARVHNVFQVPGQIPADYSAWHIALGVPLSAGKVSSALPYFFGKASSFCLVFFRESKFVLPGFFPGFFWKVVRFALFFFGKVSSFFLVFSGFFWEISSFFLVFWGLFSGK